MRITDMTGYVFYATQDRTSVDAIMDGDNESHSAAWERGMERIDEVEYWYIKLKEERERQDRERIEYHIRAARSDGWSVL